MKKVLMDLSKYLGVKGLRGVAHYYGVPESRIYSWTKKGRIANPRLILSRNPELSEEWVTTGKGPMLADKAMGHRRRRTPQQAEKNVDVEVLEVAVEKNYSEKVSLPELIKQIMAIIDAGGEAKAILEAQVKALTESLEKEREQKLLLAELTQIRASMDGMMTMLNLALSSAAKAPAVADGNSKGEDAI
ncbi:MAG: hypothetical protein LBH14_05615 [Desulfobulbaceae bacterium]|jgi:ribosome-associated protein YbcJ (S4-like RNA binding protein)|nr:hypothetical protein [Desulfobulbaceae bacterium]